MKIAIILGSTRPGRNGAAVAQWVLNQAKTRDDAEFDLIDVADYNLPFLDEPMPPVTGLYSKDHTKKWAETIAEYDGFIFVTPEYNHGTSGVLKNALDFIYKEWNNKAAGFVGYGGWGGIRAIEHLRGVASELQIAHVRAAVHLQTLVDFENYKIFKPAPHQAGVLNVVLDQVVSWSKAMKSIRT